MSAFRIILNLFLDSKLNLEDPFLGLAVQAQQTSDTGCNHCGGTQSSSREPDRSVPVLAHPCQSPDCLLNKK